MEIKLTDEQQQELVKNVTPEIRKMVRRTVGEEYSELMEKTVKNMNFTLGNDDGTLELSPVITRAIEHVFSKELDMWVSIKMKAFVEEYDFEDIIKEMLRKKADEQITQSMMQVITAEIIEEKLSSKD